MERYGNTAVTTQREKQVSIIINETQTIINETQTDDATDLTGKWEELTLAIAVANREGNTDLMGDLYEELLGLFTEHEDYFVHEVPAGLLGV